MHNLTVLNSTVNSNSNVTCSCNCTRSQHQGMEILQTSLPVISNPVCKIAGMSGDKDERMRKTTRCFVNYTANKEPGISNQLPAELEFVQIIIIIVVMTVMVVVFICLLNHYKLSTWSFINRQSQGRRQEEALQPIMYTPRSRDRFTAPLFMQRSHFSHFQTTYIQHDIDLPPTISLSDGEEPPPYKGLCTLQLRDPEQQMELNRESVQAPPNRTIFDTDLIDISMYNEGPHPPSSKLGISATNYSSNGRMEAPPPTYSEVMGNYPGSLFFHHQHSNTPPSSQRRNSINFQQNNAESTIVAMKGREGP
ncbi:UNVERIFIED_CONTAM: hypothetical protein FKN15_017932 [Acipenser sinensis]